MKNDEQIGIRDLILNKRGNRTMEVLSKDCDDIPSRANLNRMVNEPIRSWPKDTKVLTGLAKGLRVPVIDILAAYAISLGVPVESNSSILKISGAGNLPESSQRILTETANHLLEWQKLSAAVHQEEDSNVVTGNFPAIDQSTIAASRGDDTERRIDPEQLPEG